MNHEPTRVLNLLRDADAPVQADGAAPPALSAAIASWSYYVEAAPMVAWIYEFESQEALDAGIAQLAKVARPEGHDRDFAQNGAYLLVLTFAQDGENARQVKDRANRMLEAFAGEVER